MIHKHRGDLGQVPLLLTAFSIIMGAIYGFNVPRFGDPIWATVPWGIALVSLGIMVFALRTTSRNALSLGLQYVSLGLIAVMLMPPIVRWFDGQGLGVQGATPVAHWAWVIPHLVLALPWGIALVCLGVMVLTLRVTSRNALSFGLQYVSLGLIAVMQIPPTVLWFAFDGQGVGEHGATPVGHWAWAVPHIVLALLALYTGYLVRSRPNDIPRV